MQINMGTADRFLRAVIAVSLIVLISYDKITGTGAIVAMIVSGIFLLTAVLGFCPLYKLFHISSCQKP